MKRIFLTPLILSSLLSVTPSCWAQNGSWYHGGTAYMWRKNWTHPSQNGIFMVQFNEKQALTALRKVRFVKITGQEASQYTKQNWVAKGRQPYLFRAVIMDRSLSSLAYSTYKKQVWIGCITPVRQPLPLQNCAVVIWLKFKPTQAYTASSIHDYE